MTTRAILKNAYIGADHWKEGILAYFGDINLEAEDLEEILNRASVEVDKHLPGTLAWYPYLSEVWSDVEDETEIETEELNSIIAEVLEQVITDWENDPENEEKVTYTYDRPSQVDKIRDEEAEKAIEGTQIELFQILDGTWVSEKVDELKEQNITLAEARKELAEFFAELVEEMESEDGTE